MNIQMQDRYKQRIGWTLLLALLCFLQLVPSGPPALGQTIAPVTTPSVPTPPAVENAICGQSKLTFNAATKTVTVAAEVPADHGSHNHWTWSLVKVNATGVTEFIVRDWYVLPAGVQHEFPIEQGTYLLKVTYPRLHDDQSTTWEEQTCIQFTLPDPSTIIQNFTQVALPPQQSYCGFFPIGANNASFAAE